MAIAAAPKSSQMNIRINAELKNAGDALFAQWGLSPSEAVRRLYETVVQTGELPFPSSETDSRALEGDEGVFSACGLALRLYEERAGVQTASAGEQCPSYKELRDLMYDEMLDEYERMRDGDDVR